MIKLSDVKVRAGSPSTLIQPRTVKILGSSSGGSSWVCTVERAQFVIAQKEIPF